MTMPTSPCGEMLGYPRLKINEHGAFSERCLKIKAVDSASWINYFFENPYCPYFQAWGYSYPPLLIELEFKPLPNSRVTSAGSGGLASYEWGLLFLNYDGNTAIHPLTKEVVRETMTTDLESESLTTKYANWQSSTLPVTDKILQHHIPGETYTIHYPYSTTNGTNVWPGSINSDAFTSYVLGRVFPAKTLLYMGSEINITLNNAGWLRWNKKFHFKYRPWNWNSYWNPNKVGGAGFDMITYWGLGGADYKQFTETTFTGHF